MTLGERKRAEKLKKILESSSSFLSDEIKRYNSTGYENYAKLGSQYDSSAVNWKSKSSEARSYLDSIKKYVPEDEYKSYSDYLDYFDSSLADLTSGYKTKTSLYSNFSSKEQYDRYQKAATADIGELEKTLSKLKTESENNPYLPLSMRGDYNLKVNKEISDTEALLEQARDIQYGSKYAGMSYDDIQLVLNGVMPPEKTKSKSNNIVSDRINEKFAKQEAPKQEAPKAADISEEERQWLLKNADSFRTKAEKAYKYESDRKLLEKLSAEGAFANWKLRDQLQLDIDRYEAESSQPLLRAFAEDNPVLASAYSVLFSPLNALGAVDAVARKITGRQINPYSAMNSFGRTNSAIRQVVSEDMSDVGSFLYNTAMSIGDSAVAIGLGGLWGGQPLTQAIMSGGAASNTILSAKERGLSDGQAILSGIASGAAEWFFEKYSLESLDALTANGGAGLKNGIMNFLRQSFTEGTEEFFTEIANAISDTMINGELSELSIQYKNLLKNGYTPEEASSIVAGGFGQQVLESFLGGVLSGGVFGAFGAATNSISNRIEGSKFIEAGMQGKVMEAAAKAEPNSQTAKRLAEYNKKVGDGQPNAPYLGAVYRTMAQEATEALDEEAKKLRKNRKNLDSEKVKSFNEASDRANEISDLEQTYQKKVDVKEAAEKYSVSSAGSTVSNLIVDKSGDVSVKVGEKTVPISEAKVSQETSMALAYSEDMSPKMKESFFNNYETYVGSGKTSLDEYHNAFILSYEGGLYARSFDEVAKATKSVLSEAETMSLYKEGLEVRGQIAKEGPDQIASINKRMGNNTIVPGTVDDSAVRYQNIRVGDRRHAMVRLARFIAATTGRNITFFDSTKEERASGMENGHYDPKTNTISIDINAGVNEAAGVYKDCLMITLSHELVHQFAAEDKQGYALLSELVFESLTKETGKTKAQLIEGEVNRILKETPKRFKNVDKKTQRVIAQEEIVARSCEERLGESKLLKDFLSEMDQKDSSLKRRFSNALGAAIEKIKSILNEIFASYRSNSNEAKAVRNQIDNLSKIQEQFDALLERRGAQETVMTEAEIKEAQEIGINYDENSQSASPMLSERTWMSSEYVQKRREMAKKLSQSLGVKVKEAEKFIDDVNSIAKIIANDRARLDYEASSFGSAFVSNVEYGGSFDFTTLCKKRRLFTGTFSEIQRRIGENALTADEILKIRNLMIDGGFEATCGLCYVEGSRANMGKFAKQFIRLYERDNPGAWIPKMVDVNTPDGVEQMRINHPECYEQYEYFWNHYGKLKEGDPALFASQQKPKLYEARKEYKGEILKVFKDATDVIKKNKKGGIRLQSFSDFEIVHLIDTMQIIMDMSLTGLAGQAYTKVPEFAEAFGNTGLKINCSLIAKGVDSDGNLIFDDREGMPHETAFGLREKYSDNVGTVLVTFTDEQLYAAMADPRVDFIIPFHRSQWKKAQYGAMGLPKGTKDYTYQQNEKFIKKTYHEYRGRMVLDKATNYMPNDYWDFTKSGKENAENYLKKCAKENKRPKFYKLLENNGDGSYSLKADGSTDGYWKLLIDFKMYNNNGIGSPQMPVSPNFSMTEANEMLEDYKGGHQNYPVAHGVVEQFMEEYDSSSKGVMTMERSSVTDQKDDIRYQDRNYAPTFYSQMGKVIEGVKQDKLAANSVVNMLKGKGVKAEEIKWSGIVPFLDGKKSVTKAELQEFIAGSMLQVEEQVRDKKSGSNVVMKKLSKDKKGLYVDGKLVETFTEDADGWFVSQSDPSKSYGSEMWIVEEYEDLLGNTHKYSDYKLKGGKNYREILFKLPNATYSNGAMKTHWGENAKGILAHARVQDFKANGKKMLFVEEIQSDWHNEGHREGYVPKGEATVGDIRNKSADAYRSFSQSDVMQSVQNRLAQSEYEGNVTQLISDLFDGNKSAYSDVSYYANLTTEEKAFIDKTISEEQSRQDSLANAHSGKGIPDAPFRDNYHEFVLKNLIREAAENGYDSIGWTPADVQSKRWSDDFAEGYRIEYDQDIPKFLKKYGRQWGASVGSTVLNNGTEVWSMDITDSMKDSVLHEGQVMYQEREISENFTEEDRETEKNVLAKLRTRSKAAKLLQGVASYSADRIEREISNSTAKGVPDYAKSYIMWMSPLDFIYATTTNDRNRETIKKEAGKLDVEKLKTETQPIHLTVNFETGEIVGHEGRHRMTALWEEGIDRVAVIIDALNDDRKNTKPIEFMQFKGQVFGENAKGSDMYAHDLLPLSERYADYARNYFSVETASGIRMMERTPYKSARDILLEYAEEARNTKVRNEFVDEYVARVEDLDRKVLQLESAESKLALAVDSGNTKDEEFFRARVDNLTKSLDRIQKDLTKMESSNELKGIVRREKAATRKQAKQEARENLDTYKDEQERKSRISRIQAKTKLLAEKILKNNKENHIPDYLKQPVADFITAIDFSSKRKLGGGEETLVGKRYTDLLTDVKKAIEENKTDDWMVLDLDDSLVDKIDELSEQLRGFSLEENSLILNEMRSEQLKDLDLVLTGITRALNSIDRAFGESGAEKISVVAEDSIEYMQEMEAKKKAESSWITKLVTWKSFTPYTAFQRFGKGGERIYNSLLNGWGKYAKLAKQIIDFSEDTWTSKESKNWTNKVVDAELAGQSFKITKSQMMYLYLVNKRDQGIQHLDRQGFQVDAIPKVFGEKESNVAKSQLIKSSKEQRDKFFDRYMPEGSREREVADSIQRYMVENCAKWGNEISMKRWGYRAFTDPNYVPLFSEKSQLPSRAPEATNFNLHRILNLGFTKSLNAEAGNALLIYDIFDVFSEHSSDMAKYHSLGLPILDAVRWLNYRTTEFDEFGQPVRGDDTMRSVMEETWGKDAYNYVSKFLSDLNGATKNESDFADNAVAKLARNYKIAAVAANLKVALLQPTSYFRASKVISWDSLNRAVGLVAAEKASKGKRAEKYSALAEKYSGMALWKSLGFFDVNISKGLGSKIKHEENVRDKIVDLSMKGAEYGDRWTLAVLFKACHLELSKRGELKGLTQEQAWEKTGELLDQVIVQTQVVDSTITRSDLMRASTYTSRALTAFMSEPTVSLNILMNSVFDVDAERRKGKTLRQSLSGKAGKALGRSMATYGATALAASLIESLAKAWRDDDEDPFVEDFLKEIPRSFYENVSIVQKIPLVKEIVSLLENIFKGTSYGSDRMEYEAINTVVKAIQKAQRMVEKEDYSMETLYSVVSYCIKAASYATGIAASNLERELVNIWNNTFGEAFDMKITTKKQK